MSSSPKKKVEKRRPAATTTVEVWGERRPQPDWDRFVAALLSLAVRRIAEQDEEAHD